MALAFLFNHVEHLPPLLQSSHLPNSYEMKCQVLQVDQILRPQTSNESKSQWSQEGAYAAARAEAREKFPKFKFAGWRESRRANSRIVGLS